MLDQNLPHAVYKSFCITYRHWPSSEYLLSLFMWTNFGKFWSNISCDSYNSLLQSVDQNPAKCNAFLSHFFGKFWLKIIRFTTLRTPAI